MSKEVKLCVKGIPQDTHYDDFSLEIEGSTADISQILTLSIMRTPQDMADTEIQLGLMLSVFTVASQIAQEYCDDTKLSDSFTKACVAMYKVTYEQKLETLIDSPERNDD